MPAHAKPIITLFYLALLSFHVVSQAQISLHSHNDYYQDIPFWRAMVAECRSVEIDVILSDNTLYVAHDSFEINAKRTFESLYVAPLGLAFKHDYTNAKNHEVDFQYLIDLKTSGLPTLRKVVDILEKYPEYFNPEVNSGAVKIVISGNVPGPEQINEFPTFIFFDLRHPDQFEEYQGRAGLISENFRKFSRWKGKGEPGEKEKKAIKAYVDACHKAGIPVRLWATPDTNDAYEFLLQTGVNFINTDKPIEAALYLKMK